MNLFKLFLMTVLIHGCGCLGVYAQITGVDGRPSVDYNTNLVKNPSAAENTLYMDPELGTSGTLTRDTTSGNKIDGKASFLATPGDLNPLLDAFILIDLFPASDEQKSSLNRCSFSGLYKGDASAWEVVIRNGLDLVESKPLTDVTEFTPFKLTVPCVSNPRISFFSAAGSNTKAFNYGLLTYGLEKGNPVPMAVRGTYTATISSTGVIQSTSGGKWIENGVLQSGDIYHYKVNNLDTANLSCQVTPRSGTGCAPGGCNEKVYPASVDTLVVIINYNSAGNQTANISCTKTGADDETAGFYAGNLDYGPRPYTPVFTGFGTVTDIDCTESKMGAFNFIDCKFKTGTPTAVEARISLPGGIKSTFANGIRNVSLGTSATTAPSTIYNIIPLIESKSAYLTFGIGSATDAGLTKANGSQITGVGRTVSFSARVPIEGWTSSNGAYIENGIVTTGSKSKRPRIEWAIVGGSGTRGACISSTCTISKNSSDFISATRDGSGGYIVDVSGWGDVSKIDFCTANYIQLTSGNGNANIQNSPLSPSTYRVTTRQNSLTTNETDTAFGYTCYGHW